MSLFLGLIGHVVLVWTVLGAYETRDDAYTYCVYHSAEVSSQDGVVKIVDAPSGHMTGSSQSDASKQNSSVRSIDIPDHNRVLLDNDTVERCPSSRDVCFSMWTLKENGTRLILMQGCWNGQVCQESNKSGCAGYPIVLNNSSYFCCCQGDMCNTNLSEGGSSQHARVSPPPVLHQVDPHYRLRAIIIALTSVAAAAVLILIIFLIIRLHLRSPTILLKDPPIVEPPLSPTFDLDNLKLTSLISHGRFGEVWKGTLDDFDVAVKVFTPTQRNLYTNERDIYMMPFMEHDYLPRFFGSEERLTEDGLVQYLLVMSYVPCGTLAEYITQHTISWQTLCKMCHSISSGLAHLHCNFTRSGLTKLSVAHRDLNTRNILVREDLRCCLIDLGFAMKIESSRVSEADDAEQTLTDVGTLRYMAPEVLEGAVNLRDCEASLRQIDVYSLGLIFWETGMRCHDLYQGLPAPEYQLPFQADLGVRPTFEQMQFWVARSKKRPLFPDIWKDTNQAIRAFKDTIEDCWDQDAEARLTAMCVEERSTEMMTLWETRHKGVTPTITSLCDPEKVHMQRNPTCPNPPQEAPSDPQPPDNAAPQLETNQLQAQQQQRQRSSYSAENSVSTCTVETTLLSPSEPDGVQSVTQAGCLLGTRNVAPAHRGHNPTVERNTHKCSSEELAVLGNSLVNKNLSVVSQPTSSRAPVSRMPIFSSALDHLEGSLVQNDLLNTTSGGHSEPLVVRPKQSNLPGNGNVSGTDSRSLLLNGNSRKTKGSGRIGVLSVKKFSLPQFMKRKTSKNQDVDEPCTVNFVDSIVGKSNLEPRPNAQSVPRPTEVCLLNGSAVVRPTSLPLNGDATEGAAETEAPQNTHLQGHVVAQAGRTINDTQPPKMALGNGYAVPAKETLGGPSGLGRVKNTGSQEEMMESETSSTCDSDLPHNATSKIPNGKPRPPPTQHLDTTNGNLNHSEDVRRESQQQTRLSWYDSQCSGQDRSTADIVLQQFPGGRSRIRLAAEDYQC